MTRNIRFVMSSDGFTWDCDVGGLNNIAKALDGVAGAVNDAGTSIDQAIQYLAQVHDRDSTDENTAHDR